MSEKEEIIGKLVSELEKRGIQRGHVRDFAEKLCEQGACRIEDLQFLTREKLFELGFGEISVTNWNRTQAGIPLCF